MTHLLALLDDPSETVRGSVKAALAQYGNRLAGLLDDAEASSEQRATIEVLLAPEPESEAPLFEVGQLVRHKRYGYRGVVVAVDDECQASEDWYQRNRTQPERDQPWYHVLADGSSQVFYPAETSLAADASNDEVDNPLVARFFDGFTDGSYIRNDRPWRPGSE